MNVNNPGNNAIGRLSEIKRSQAEFLLQAKNSFKKFKKEEFYYSGKHKQNYQKAYNRLKYFEQPIKNEYEKYGYVFVVNENNSY